MMKHSKGHSDTHGIDKKEEKPDEYVAESSQPDRPNPRTILLQRDENEFGFTLRHFIVYPPTNIKVTQSKSQVSSESLWQKERIEPMDTIFVREVKEGSPAHQAGLVTGDRIITINGEPLAGKTYSEVIDLIYKSGNSLQLLVVPKEDDILQLYFASSAYQPVEREPRSTSHPQLHFTPWNSLNDHDDSIEPMISSESTCGDSIANTPMNASEENEETPKNIEPPTEAMCQQPTENSDNIEQRNSVKDWETSEDGDKPQLKDVLCCRDSIASTDSCQEQTEKGLIGDRASLDWEEPCKSADVSGSQTTLSTYSSVVRPHRFQDTLSKLLYDMWYHPDPSRQDSGVQLEDSFDASRNYCSDIADSDDKRDHKTGGIATLISRTMKALVAHPSDFKLFSSETQSSLNSRKASSDSKVNIVSSSNSTSEKLLPTTSSESLYYSSYKPNQINRKTGKGRYQRVKPHHKHLRVSNHHSFDSIDYLDKKKNLEYTTEDADNDEVSSLHLVAQRLHLFESGHLAAKSLERTKFYRSELARMSEQSHIPIVSVRAAQFENLSPACKPDYCKNSLLSLKNEHYFSDTDSQQPSSLPLFSTESKDSAATSTTTAIITATSSNVTSPVTSSGVVYRRKTIPSGDRDDHHIVRRISYLRATARDRIHIDSDISDDEATDSSVTPVEHRIKKLKAFFGEKTPKIKDAIDPSCAEEREEPFLFQGWLICKLVNLEGKRASDRSWRPVWAVLQGDYFYLLKDKKDITQVPLDDDEQAIDLRLTNVGIAHDYTKRKNVLRLQLLNKTEYLFQADNQSSMIKWLCALKISGTEDEKKLNSSFHTSVLEKAAAYEQQIQNHKGRISPLTVTKPGKKVPFRHRSPSGHSPATKTRRASHGDELALPKFGTMWRDRVAQGWKKVHGISALPPRGGSFGVKLEDCPAGANNEFVPLLVETCIGIVESKGLDVVGIYRVPGNNAAVSMLMDVANQGIDKINLEDYRWKDVNVVSSLLKAFFRKLPEPLLTSHLYSKFINASKLEDPVKKLTMFKTLAHQLPRHHLETLKLLMKHLQNIVSHSNVNKMEARNLAIVFGPTLVRSAENSMVTMVTDMSHQCYIIETMITYADWLFGEKSIEKLPKELTIADKGIGHSPPALLHNALLSNIHKIDGTHSGGVSDELLSNLMGSTRQRWHRRKGVERSLTEEKPHINGNSDDHAKQTDSEMLPITNYNSVDFTSPSSLYSNHKSFSTIVSETVHLPKLNHHSKDWPLTSSEQHDCPRRNEETLSDEIVHNYDELSAVTQERIRNFEMETKALLQRDNHWPKQSFGSNKVQWEQIEKEWQKAKIEMEQDDIFDHLADDPSNYISMFNGSESCDKHSFDRIYSHELENVRTNLDKRLQLGSEFDIGIHASQFNSANNYPHSGLQRSLYEELSSEEDSSIAKSQTDNCGREQRPLQVFLCEKLCSSNVAKEKANYTSAQQAINKDLVSSTGYDTSSHLHRPKQGEENGQCASMKQNYENLVITATISPSKQTISSTTSIPVIRATVITSSHQPSLHKTRKTQWSTSTTNQTENLLPETNFLQRRHTIAGPRIVSRRTCVNHPEMIRSSEDVLHHHS